MASDTLYVDTSVLPLLLVRWPKDITSRSIDQFIAGVTPHFQSGKPFLILSDGRDISWMPAAQRKQLAEWSNQAVAMNHRCLASVNVVSSKIVAGLVTAVGWLTRSDRRYQEMFGDIRKALHYLDE